MHGKVRILVHLSTLVTLKHEKEKAGGGVIANTYFEHKGVVGGGG